MKARLLPRVELSGLVELLEQQWYQVVAPFVDLDGDTAFARVTPENRGAIALHLPNPLYPPKRFVLPHLEPLLRIRRTGRALSFEPAGEPPRVAVLGMRSCDVAGLAHLDAFFLGGAFRDPYYQARRRRLLVVNVACTDPRLDIGDACFCPCTDTGPAARDGFDLQLTDLSGDGQGDELLALAGSAAGEALLAQPPFRPATPAHVARRRAALDAAQGRFRTATSWFSAAVRHVSRGDVPEATWEELGARCLECGGCSYVCPACTCFTVADHPVGADEVERVRLWDSCALSGFTRMAGGHNPRKAVHDRRNRRFFRKLSLPVIEREGAVACAGCGRCVEVCHGDVGMPVVVERLRRGAGAPPAGEARP